MSNRNRAWRRRQRARAIQNRQDRLPEVSVPDPVQLWQLHGPDGKPLNVLKRLRGGYMESVEDIPVTVRHNYNCPMYTGFAWLREEVFRKEPRLEHCQCKGRLPNWADPLLPELGSFWRFVREYTPDHRPFPDGKLDKSPPASNTDSWSPAGADTGNMRFMLNNHRGKLYEGSKSLGRDATEPDRHWREWDEAWDGADWGEPEPEAE